MAEPLSHIHEPTAPGKPIAVTAEDKFIAFVDILGFSEMVRTAEANGGDLSALIDLTQLLTVPGQAKRIAAHSSPTCPHSKRLSKDLNFKATQISDCVVFSCEISPAGIINLLNSCFEIVLNLMQKGFLCRGSVTRGKIYHTDNQFMGSGYMEAYSGESKVSIFKLDNLEKGTPFIQLENRVVDYVRDFGDDCVRTLASRMTATDGTYTAISPFDALAKIPATMVTSGFDPQKFKSSVQRSRAFRLENLRLFEAAESAATTPEAKRKISHYKRGFMKVLKHLDEKEQAVDKMIETGIIPYGTMIS